MQYIDMDLFTIQYLCKNKRDYKNKPNDVVVKTVTNPKAICEILLLNDSIRELIIARSPTRLVREAARKNGTRFLREIAMDAVANGETTLQEINRVTLVG